MMAGWEEVWGEGGIIDGSKFLAGATRWMVMSFNGSRGSWRGASWTVVGRARSKHSELLVKKPAAAFPVGAARQSHGENSGQKKGSVGKECGRSKGSRQSNGI